MKFSAFFLLFVLTLANAFGANIKFESLASGQMRATGSDFNNGATNNKQINFYKNGKFFEQVNMNSNGSFSYTSPKNTFVKNDIFSVKVLQYISNNKHYEKSATYDFSVANHGLEFTNLDNGQIRVVGKNFNQSLTNDEQVNFYKNGDFIDHIFRNSNGSFSYTTPSNTFNDGDKITVKVLNYLGNGKHFTETSTYKVSYEDNYDYIEGCYKNTGTYSNEELCLRLKVPARISKGCGLYTATFDNEAICLTVRTEPDTAKACFKYMGTYSNEAACLKTKNLSPAIIKQCGNATTYSGELTCIQTASHN